MLKPCTSHLVDRVISTKVGATRRPDKSWVFFNTPENLRALKQKQIQLVHLRLMEYGAVLLEEQLGSMLKMQRAGKILHVSLRSVTRAEMEAGLKFGGHCHGDKHVQLRAPHHGGAAVRHQSGRRSSAGLVRTARHLTPFFFSLVHGLPSAGNKLLEMVKKHNVTEAQIDAGLL